ncbi:MAG: GH92 family glycosyl hydrolase [Candidatus Krumholzibacteriota bacterium]|nr:GH92 family glycosyl hydrolase [Candidatus Krumholzibacteriota bacterium]
MIGTDGHGHTYPGATLPFGMVQLSPDTRLTGWDGCSAYHYSDSLIYGFSHTHLSGTGCSDYGDILLMPVSISGDIPGARAPLGNGADGGEGYRSSFDHTSERALPGFYSVYLTDNQAGVQLTATLRCGFHKYRFPEGKRASIVLDLAHRDKVIDSAINIVSDTEITGFRRSLAWAEDQHIYFVARFSSPVVSRGLSAGGVIMPGAAEGSGKDLRGWFNFEPGDDGVIMVKVGISAVSIDGARKNLDAEIPGWDFAHTAKNAVGTWERSLSRIKASGGTAEQKRIFYTALYHSLLVPNIFSDVDGCYRGRDLMIHKTDGFDYYTVFSLWDTYRAAHPLFTIIEPERTIDFIKTFLRQYEEGGALPVWELAANETGCMIGYHSVPVIVDAYFKGLDRFDAELALEAMKAGGRRDHLGLASYKRHGYIRSEDAGQSVSRTLEYAYDDWCISRFAGALGDKADESEFLKRAQSYKNLFDPSTGFMRARLNGGFVEPFDPVEVNFHYTEANSWQYSFYVPQDISGLARLHGGMHALEAKLDSLFTQSSGLRGLDQPDVSGLIGQYAHGNEPSQHMAYLYNFTGSPWKTQARVREIMETMYSGRPDGLCGNEDCGQMSAWFVFSAAGFYPVTPGQESYIIGTPLFDEVVIETGEGRSFTIIAERDADDRASADDCVYIISAILNGNKYDRSYIDHEDIVRGGTLRLKMGRSPSPAWGRGGDNIPLSVIEDDIITPAPFISTDEMVFQDSITIALACAEKDAEIRFTTDGSEPGRASGLYAGSFTLRESATVKAAAFSAGSLPSSVVTGSFTRMRKGLSVTLKNEYSPLYPAGGSQALVDMIRGGEDFRTGGWQGYQGVDFEAVLDLGAVQDIGGISAGFLHDQGSWIFLPRSVEFALSKDGRSFETVARLNNTADDMEKNSLVWEPGAFGLSEKARYIRVKAETIGLCPDWHPGAGNRGWIFIDEISVE